MIRLQRSLMMEGLGGTTPDLQAVKDGLQKAIKLEHATIPLYLYALYSLDEAKNQDIADIIQSVVVEEMLHMTLACNVLNALGGSPVIDEPDFIPTYPGPLPGGVDAGETFSLAPFSTGQLEAFIALESPADPLVFESLAVEDSVTIGEFYTTLQSDIKALGDSVFVPGPRNQIPPDLMEESIIVTNVTTAVAALAIIIDQGEGTSTTPEEIDGPDLAHYYRYNQIKKGHFLVRVPGETEPKKAWRYNGAAIPFDPSGVYPVATNPSSRSYPPGSAQALANDNFNHAYTSLLSLLHDFFNGVGSPPVQFGRAIGLMMAIKGQAKAMMSGSPNPALMIGPSFEYLAVNP